MVLPFNVALYSGVSVAALNGGAAAPGFDPTTVTGVLAVYDISDLSSLFQERTGASATTAAVVDGPVGTVLNQVSGGPHLTAPSDAARPLLRQSGSYYYLEHDGSNDVLSAQYTGTFGLPLEIHYAIETFASDDIGWVMAVYDGVSDYTGHFNAVTERPQIRAYATEGDSLITAPVASAPKATPLVLGIQTLVSPQELRYLNRSGVNASTAGPAGAYMSNPKLVVGGQRDDLVTSLPLKFSALVFGTTTMSAGDLADVRTWLAERNGAVLS